MLAFSTQADADISAQQDIPSVEYRYDIFEKKYYKPPSTLLF
ncbi:hypothetical protein N643_06760 [Salmonella bongori serovar 48:z41:-- str. RKS3044]|uniref:Uncharacterized protein n=1 Tax=Salmonella bongori N268-08 TaxID=1197719 RepID=S5MW17_SALBN|nr:hypothetical protein A464_1609 [Salmonella bongori N268-08]AID27173.1 hypothetical protein N643_06760 [Salmonella bongori serovar 48:z41:-- str. RKS3044]